VSQPSLNSISYRTVHEIFGEFTLKFWDCEVLSLTNFLLNTLNKIITQYRWPANHIYSSIFEHFILLSLQFLQSLHFGRKPLTNHDQSQLMYLVGKKWITVDFAAGGTIIRRAHQKQTLGDQLCDSIQGNKSYDTTSHAWALPPLLH
jgi:hypothetical protein